MGVITIWDSAPTESLVTDDIFVWPQLICYKGTEEWLSLVAQMIKESACNAGDLGSIPGLGRSSGEENDYPLQYSCLENPMER